MRQVIQDIYTKLNEEMWTLTERRFSEEYLGKNETYWAYIKSKNAQPSIDALVSLWGKLANERRVCEYKIQQEKNIVRRKFLLDWVSLVSSLEKDAFSTLINKAMPIYGSVDRCNVVRKKY